MTIFLGLHLLQTHTYVATNVRASRLVAQVAGYPKISDRFTLLSGPQGLVPNGIELQALDEERKILITGNSEACANVAAALARFDIKQSVSRLRIRIESPLDNFDVTSVSEVMNLQVQEISFPSIDAKLQICPRINADGTIFVSAKVESGKNSVSASFRVTRVNPGLLAVGRNLHTTLGKSNPKAQKDEIRVSILTEAPDSSAPRSSTR